MPYTINFTNLRVENVQVFQEFDDEGNFLGLQMSLNGTLYNSSGDDLGKTKLYELTTAQKAQVQNFIKGFVQDAASEWDVEPPPWAV